MKEANLPASFDEALKRVRESPSSSEGFAFLGTQLTFSQMLKQPENSFYLKVMQLTFGIKLTPIVTFKWLEMSSVESHMPWLFNKAHH